MKTRICVLSPGILPWFNLSKNRTGGAEKQVSYMIKSLWKDYEFHVLAYDLKRDRVKLGPILFYKIQKYFAKKNFFINYLESRLVLPFVLFHLIRKCDCDVIYQRAYHKRYIWIYLWSKILNKKSIYHISDDSQISVSNINFSPINFLLNLVYRQSELIAQNNYQISEALKINDRVVKVPQAIKLPIKVDYPLLKKVPYVIWISNIKRKKGLEILLDIADRMTNISFVMVGGISDERYFSNFSQKISSLKNVKRYDYVTPSKLEIMIKEATLLLNTSHYEGFANTFLEAWSNCLPVVSYNIDPDDLIRKEGIGFVSNNVQELCNKISLFITDKELCNKIGNKGREIVEKRYSTKNIAKYYKEFFEKVLVN